MTAKRTAPAKGQRTEKHVFLSRAPAGDAAAGERTRRFVASDETVDRYGDIIRASGWQLERFRKNPQLLFGHQSNEFPIGTVTDIFVKGTELIAEARFFDEGVSARADECWRIVEAGGLRAVSVGFMPTEPPNFIRDEPDKDGYAAITGFEFVGQELLELSVVPVPANPQALALAKSLGLTVERNAWLFEQDERAAARVAAQHRRNHITLARLRAPRF